VPEQAPPLPPFIDGGPIESNCSVDDESSCCAALVHATRAASCVVGGTASQPLFWADYALLRLFALELRTSPSSSSSSCDEPQKATAPVEVTEAALDPHHTRASRERLSCV
jgi:hypothetical protein